MQREQATHASRRRFLQGMGVGVAGMAAEGHAQTSGVKPLRGIFPIAQSPFTQDDTLDLDGLAAQVGFCNRGGVHGFVWPQIVSAWTTLSEKQRLDGAEAILAAGKRGRAALVIGVQTVDGNLEGAIRYAKHAEKHGADAIICIPPTRMTDDRGVLEYYKALGHATELPLILQSQGNMSVDVVVRMSQEIPTMPVVKDEAGNALVRINEVRDRTKGKLGVFSGAWCSHLDHGDGAGLRGALPDYGSGRCLRCRVRLVSRGKAKRGFRHVRKNFGV